MPSLGTSFYPTIAITEAIEATTAVEREFRGSITTGGLASHLGMTETGGAFRHKLTALHRYGLLSGRGTLTVTPLGQRISHPTTDEERDTAIAEAFLNIDLFRRIRDRFQDSSPTDSQLRIVLEEMTGASRRDIALRLTRIRRFYLDGFRYLHPSAERNEDAGEGASVLADQRPAMAWGKTVDAAGEGQMVLSDGAFRLPVERSVRGIRLLRKYLDLLEEQLGMEAESEDEHGGLVE